MISQRRGNIMINNLDMPKQSGIYLLKCLISGKIYIGKAVNLRNRMGKHKNSINSKRNTNSMIVNAIRKHGWENFECQIIELIDDKNKLMECEIYWIDFYDSTNRDTGYNILRGGTDWTGYKHTEETKLKLSLSRKGKYVGENSPNFGLKRSDETKAKLSEQAKLRVGEKNSSYGKKRSDETKKKLSNSLKIAFSGENNKYRLNLSQKAKERFKTQPNPMLGKTMSLEAKKKISDNKLGKSGKFIAQLDKESGNVIKIWRSQTNAIKSITGKPSQAQTISRVCSGKQSSAFGYKWRFATPEEINNYNLILENAQDSSPCYKDSANLPVNSSVCAREP